MKFILQTVSSIILTNIECGINVAYLCFKIDYILVDCILKFAH